MKLDAGDHHVAWFNEWLKEDGYEGMFYAKKDNYGNDVRGINIGNMLCWKSSKFKILEAKKHCVNKSIVGKCNLGGSKKVYITSKFGCSANFVLLESVDGYRVAACTTHLSAPRADDDYDAMMAQLMQIIVLLNDFAEFVRHCLKYGECAVILCGDFNARPISEVYQIIANKCIQSKKAESDFIAASTLSLPPKSPFQLSSAFSCLFGKEPEFTNITHKFQGCLDYVFHGSSCDLEGRASSPMKTIKVIPVSVKLLVDESHQRDPKLPSEMHPSDHIPIHVDYTIEESEPATFDPNAIDI